MRYTEIKRRNLSWSLLPGGWPRTRQDKQTPGMEPGPAPCRGVLESPAPLEVGIRSLVPPRGMRRIDTGSRFARGVRFLRGERGHLAGHKPSLRPLSPFQGPLCRFWAFLRRFSLGSAVSRSSIAIIPTPLSAERLSPYRLPAPSSWEIRAGKHRRRGGKSYCALKYMPDSFFFQRNWAEKDATALRLPKSNPAGQTAYPQAFFVKRESCQHILPALLSRQAQGGKV